MTKKSKSKQQASKNSEESLLDQYVLKYLASRPDMVEYEDFVNEQIKAYDEREKKRIEELERLENEPDADGFVTVVSKRPVVLEEGEETRRPAKATKVLPNFYSFEAKNQKQGQLEELQRKFEEDRRRLQELKRCKMLQ